MFYANDFHFLHRNISQTELFSSFTHFAFLPETFARGSLGQPTAKLGQILLISLEQLFFLLLRLLSQGCKGARNLFRTSLQEIFFLLILCFQDLKNSRENFLNFFFFFLLSS